MAFARTMTASPRRSARLVTWARAWRAGIVSYDDVADQTEGDEEHLVADAPETWTDIPLREAVRVLSRVPPDEIRLVLPAPGDPRGLPGPGPFSAAAMEVGEGIVAGHLGLVPTVRRHTSGSGDTFDIVIWQVYPLPAGPSGLGGPNGPNGPNGPSGPSGPGGTERNNGTIGVAAAVEPSAAEAEAELATALADATKALQGLDVAAWRPELAGALSALRRPDNSTDLPPGFSPRARRLFARATVLDRMLALAAEMAPGGAINGYEAQQRDAALRPLTAACRRALVAACNSPLEP